MSEPESNEKQGYENSLKRVNAIFQKGVRVKELDTGKTKTGDGQTKWNDLPWD